MVNIILTKENGLTTAYCYKNNTPDRISFFHDSAIVIGSVYVALVKQVKKEQEAAFVELLPGITAYLPFEECLTVPKEGQSVLCQVKREPIKTKPYMVSEKIELSSIHIAVSFAKTSFVHVSKKISSDLQKKLIDSFKEQFKENRFGVILRTHAALKFEEAKNDYVRFAERLDDFDKKGHTRKQYTKLYEPIFLQSLLDSYYGEEISILTQDHELYLNLKQEYNDMVSLYEDTSISLFARYSLQSFIDRATNKKIWLKCGGYIVIEPTEALTVIDVNSGKCDLKKNKTDLLHKVNEEAAMEIALQLRLRNISGIIMIDFMNESKENISQIKSIMQKEIQKDYVKVSFSEITKLGIMELSRQKSSGSVYEYLKILC